VLESKQTQHPNPLLRKKDLMAKKTIAVDTPDDTTEQPEQSNHAPGTTLMPSDMAALGAAIAAGIAQTQPARKVTIGEYVRRGAINQYHTGKKALKMTREYYQNGKMIYPDTCFDKEIELLNQITHSGRYIDRLVEVVVIQNGSEEAVDIRFSNKVQFAFELKGKARDFTDILEQIVAAQKIEREDMEDDKADRQERAAARRSKATSPSFGNGKATRAAREAAGV
jgi:hypothetical protein